MGENYDGDAARLEALEEIATENDGLTRADIEGRFTNLPWVAVQYDTNEALTDVKVTYTKDGVSATFEMGNDKQENLSSDTLGEIAAGPHMVSYIVGSNVASNPEGTEARLGLDDTDAYGTYVFTISGTTEDGDLVTVASQSVTYRGGEDAESFVTVNFVTEGTMNPVEIYVGEAETVDLSNLVAPSYTNGEYLFQKWTVDGDDPLTAVKVPENKTITVTAAETEVENAAVDFRANGLWDATKSPYAEDGQQPERFNSYD